MVYNTSMDGEEGSAIELYNENVQVQQIMRVRELQVEKNLTVEKACERINLSPRTFYSWLSKDVFTDYLRAERDARQTYAATQAVEAMPSIMDHMIGLATGKISARGGSPIAAAKFVLQVAEQYVPPSEEEEASRRTTYSPQQVVIIVEDGAPALIDGKVVIRES